MGKIYDDEGVDFDLDSCEKIERYQLEVDILLAEFGLEPEEVLVTDKSKVSDFFNFKREDDKKFKKIEHNINQQYGVTILLNDYIWRAAEKMKHGK